MGIAQETILEKKITLALNEHSISDALSKIEQNENCFFSYNQTTINTKTKFTKRFVNLPLRSVLDELFQDYKMYYQVEGDIVYIRNQARKGKIIGHIKDEKGKPIPYASIILKNTSYGSASDENGNYNFSAPEGNHKIVVNILGYESREKQIIVLPDKTTILNFEVIEKTNDLSEVVVEGSLVRKNANDPIKMNILDTQDFQIQSVGVAEILKTAPGIVVRRSGGFGSNASVNLNGLSGNAVRIYYDGFPMEYLGDGFNLSNIPGNVVDRIEVFKGVTPTEKGIDALAGGVNIVSKKNFNRDQIEATYQVGSFNTHLVSTLIGKKVSDRFSVFVKGFYNHSDNNYRMKNVNVRSTDSVPDRFGTGYVRSGEIITLKNVERFHNAHTSKFLQAGLHFNSLKWADQITLSGNYSERFDEDQNGRVLSTLAITEATRKTTSKILSLQYVKNFLNDNLFLSYRGVLSNGKQASDDASFFTIDWNRQIVRQNETLRSEFSGGVGRPIARRTDRTSHAHRIVFAYKLMGQHKLTFSNFFANSDTTFDDLFDSETIINGETIKKKDIPAFFTKNIAGLEWKSSWLNNGLSMVVFAKHYYYRAKSLDVGGSGIVPTSDVYEQDSGYGSALKYRFSNDFFARFSYENTLRIPTESEIYGNGTSILPNFSLRPEQGHNFNLGISFGNNLGKNLNISTSIDGFLRNTQDLIAIRAVGNIGRFFNNRDTKSLGVEWTTKLSIDDFSNVTLNLTKQKRTYSAFGAESNSETDAFINTPIPNIPFFFYNVLWNVGVKSFKKNSPDVSLFGSFFHIGDFSITDVAKNGIAEPLSIVPVQNELNLGMGYTTKNKKLRVSFQVNNVTNNFELFDNFRIPKPNRNYQLKINFKIP